MSNSIDKEIRKSIRKEIKNERKNERREPKQSRSIEMKEKILDSAFQLFCEKGYYKTTTNEIAQRAEVSIGSLYSYFKDKDTVFFEILDRYHDKYDMSKNETINNPELLKTDLRSFLHTLITTIIKVHEESKDLNRELNILSYNNTKIAEILEKQRKETLKVTVDYFMRFKDDIKTDDIEATAIVTFDLLSATVDRIVFGKNEIDRERLIDTAIDIICKYFEM